MGEKCIIDPARDCLGLAKAEMLEKQVDEYRRQARETHAQLFDRYKQIMEKLDQLLAWQNAQQNKPQTFMDDLKGKIIWTVVVAIITFILARIGL